MRGGDAADMSAGTLILYTAALIAAMAAIANVLPVITHLEGRSGTAGHEAAQEVATQLDVAGVLGTRNSTSADVWDVRAAVTLPDGASPLDLTQLVLTYDDAHGVHRLYAHSAAPLADGAAPAATFNATWALGAGGSTFVMQPGDRVTLHFNLDGPALPPRTQATLTLSPAVGAQSSATWLTPARSAAIRPSS